ncbi:MAG: hypothetical protein AAGD06_07585 [Acidobacteriota bacterium]
MDERTVPPGEPEPRSDVRIERRAVIARRHAYRGDVETALGIFRELMPAAPSDQRRHLWLLARYAEALRLSKDLGRYETLCWVIDEMVRVWRSWHEAAPPLGKVRSCARRQLSAGIRALLATARRAGHDSGIGRSALDRARSVLSLAGAH